MRVPIIPVMLPQEEHDRLDREAERWKKENPELAALPPDPIYLLHRPLTAEETEETRRILREIKAWLKG